MYSWSRPVIFSGARVATTAERIPTIPDVPADTQGGCHAAFSPPPSSGTVVCLDDKSCELFNKSTCYGYNSAFRTGIHRVKTPPPPCSPAYHLNSSMPKEMTSDKTTKEATTSPCCLLPHRNTTKQKLLTARTPRFSYNSSRRIEGDGRRSRSSAHCFLRGIERRDEHATRDNHAACVVYS